MWKKIVEGFDNVDLIFPTQQRDVLKLVKGLRKHENVLKIVIFGSSTRSDCNPWSDLDVYIELKEDKYPRMNYGSIEAALDVWTNFTVDEQLYNEIMETGVVVYTANGS